MPLAFGPFRLDAARRHLIRLTAAGEEPVAIGSRAMDLLSALVDRPGELVTKDALMEAGWPGQTVEENNLSVQVSSLRRALGDGRDGLRLIETVPGRGYRFVGLVAAERDAAAAAAPPPAEAVRTRRVPPRVWRAAVSVLCAALIAGALTAAFAAWTADPRPALSIAVLPFASGAADQSSDYLAEAITDDLTARVATMTGAFVIGRATARAFRGQTDTHGIGTRLGVRYLVEGSVRPLGALVRVTATLVEADSGAALWSEQFDAGLDALPSAQDDVVGRIANVLGSRLINVEARRLEREHPARADSADLVLRARAILTKPQNAERNEAATALLRQALARDPGAVGAMTMLGNLLLTRWTLLRDPDGNAARTSEARLLLDRAAAINPTSFGVLALRALLLRVDGRWDDAAVAYRAALAANPIWSPGYNQLALCALALGHPEEVVPLLEKALRLDPMAADIHTRYALMGQALIVLARDEDAVRWLRRAVQAFPPPQTMYRDLLAAALARAGHREEAEDELRQALDRLPCMTVSAVRHRSGQPVAGSLRDALADGLALAGLRDHAGAPGRVTPPPGRCDSKFEQPPGVARITAADLRTMITAEMPPVLLTTARTDRVVPGTITLTRAPVREGATPTDANSLRQHLERLTGGDPRRPIVVIPWNIETAGRQRLATLIASLGYRQVYSFPDGLEAWITMGLPTEQARLM